MKDSEDLIGEDGAISSDVAGKSYEQLIKEQLDEERSRKASLEQRAVFVITSSGTLATLLFGLATVVTGTTGLSLSGTAKFFLVCAVPLFLASAVLGILVNAPRDYDELGTDELARIVEPDYWQAAGSIGARRSAEARITVLRTARSLNLKKAKQLFWALIVEVIAVGAVALTVVLILLR